jgi:hypothetical protein
MRVKPTRSRCAVALAAALVAVLAGRAAGYGLEFTALGDTVQHVGPSDVAEFHFLLTNAGNQSDAYELDCRVVSAVNGWVATYCVRGRCVEPGVLVYDTLPAGNSDTTIKVTVYTNASDGEEVVSLRARSMGDTALAESIATHTIVGSGIEERARLGAPESRLMVTPTLVNRRTGALVAFSTREQACFKVALRDAAGRLVQTVADGVLPAGRHRIRWRPECGLPGGVYLLRLSAGDVSAVAKVIVE